MAVEIFVEAGEEGEVVADGGGFVEVGAFGEVGEVGFAEDAEGLVFEPDFAAGGDEEAGDELHEGGFAGAVFAEEAVDFTRFEGEVDVREDGFAAVAFGEVRDLKQRRAGG